MDLRLENFRSAYRRLSEGVRISVQTRVGDCAHLQSQADLALRFLAAAERVLLLALFSGYRTQVALKNIEIFPMIEYETLRQSIAVMVESLDLASQPLQDTAHGIPLTPMARRITNGRGRPRCEFDPRFLEFALQLRGPAQLGAFFGCSARTVRRRALKYGLTVPGAPVYHDAIQDDGTITRVWPGTTTHTRLSQISQDELDSEMIEVLTRFPFLGRRLIDGYLKSKGLHVSRQRIVESFRRVRGVPAGFGRRRIERRVYYVPAVNSLWHHDGQHGSF